MESLPTEIILNVSVYLPPASLAALLSTSRWGCSLQSVFHSRSFATVNLTAMSFLRGRLVDHADFVVSMRQAAWVYGRDGLAPLMNLKGISHPAFATVWQRDVVVIHDDGLRGVQTELESIRFDALDVDEIDRMLNCLRDGLSLHLNSKHMRHFAQLAVNGMAGMNAEQFQPLASEFRQLVNCYLCDDKALTKALMTATSAQNRSAIDVILLTKINGKIVTPSFRLAVQMNDTSLAHKFLHRYGKEIGMMDKSAMLALATQNDNLLLVSILSSQVTPFCAMMEALPAAIFSVKPDAIDVMVRAGIVRPSVAEAMLEMAFKRVAELDRVISKRNSASLSMMIVKEVLIA